MRKNSLVAACLVFLAAPCWAGLLEDIRTAVEQGDAQAQYELGNMYNNGLLEVSRDVAA